MPVPDRVNLEPIFNNSSQADCFKFNIPREKQTLIRKLPLKLKKNNNDLIVDGENLLNTSSENECKSVPDSHLTSNPKD